MSDTIKITIKQNITSSLENAAAWPVASAIPHFRDEFEWNVRHPKEAMERNYGLANYADAFPPMKV